MKNYLGNLLARHMNQVEVLQPRLASRFEPQSSVLQTDTEVLQPPAGEGEVEKPNTPSPESETTATEFTVAPEIDRPVAINRPVAGQAVQPARTTETTPLHSSIAPLLIPQPNAIPPSQPPQLEPAVSVFTQPAEGPDEPTIVLGEQREKPEKPIEQANSNVHAVRHAEVFDSEPPVAETNAAPPPAAPPPAAPQLTKKSQPAETVTQVALPHETEDVEDQLPVERFPVESVPARATKKHSARLVPASPTQMLTPSSTNNFQLQAPVPQTESAGAQAVPHTVSLPPVYSVAPPEVRRNAEPPKLDHTEAPADSKRLPPVVLPATKIPAHDVLRPSVNSAERAHPIQSSVDPRKRNSEETATPHPTQRASSLETVITTGPRTDLMSARRQFRDEALEVKAEPTVNVTIGRIEVRAATKIPEAQPQKERREHQVLSLDEYLSQRSAGGR